MTTRKPKTPAPSPRVAPMGPDDPLVGEGSRSAVEDVPPVVPTAEPDVRRPAAEGSRSQAAGSNPLAAAMSENELEQHIRRILADLPDILWYHTRDSRRSPSGFPDLACAGPRGVLYRELKREGKKPTTAQAEWLRALVIAGQDACVWRPSDLLAGRIARKLAAIAWPVKGGARANRPTGGAA